MKIAISGGASQGKSTIVNHLSTDTDFSSYVFKTNLTRSLQEQGFLINESGNAVTQLFVMAKHYEFLNIGGNVVLDRCALDGLAYSMYFFKEMEISIQRVLVKLFEAMVPLYDKIFYITPELPLISDGQRSVNYDFFNAVNINFDNIISNYNIPVIRISGTVEERVEKIKNNL